MEQKIPRDVLEMLCCPQCRQPVALEGAHLVCSNRECGLRYPVKDGIPVMLIEEAVKPSPVKTEPTHRS